MEVDLDGRHALVTGAGSGIGAACATRLAAAGATVTVLDLDADAAKAVAGEISGTALVADLSDLDVIEDLDLARIDILVPIWGLALGAATLAYHLRRRGTCVTCHRG